MEVPWSQNKRKNAITVTMIPGQDFSRKTKDRILDSPTWRRSELGAVPWVSLIFEAVTLQDTQPHEGCTGNTQLVWPPKPWQILLMKPKESEHELINLIFGSTLKIVQWEKCSRREFIRYFYLLPSVICKQEENPERQVQELTWCRGLVL